MRIGIQGERASFHDVATTLYFEEKKHEVVPAASFERLCSDLSDGKTDRAVMAIENAIAGSILTNYSLLEQHRFKVLGELYLRISLDLMALPGQEIEEIESVQSHPMALLQCQKYLSRFPGIKAIEVWDTAGAAKDIQERSLKKTAAVASSMAAELYGLEVLSAGIENDKRNYTRFLLVTRELGYEPPNHANKTSLRFETGHAPGSLARVLDILARHSINLTKIQSVPILGQPYRYSFHVDLQWEDRDGYQRALKEMQSHLINLIHFGDYVSSKRPPSDPASEPDSSGH